MVAIYSMASLVSGASWDALRARLPSSTSQEPVCIDTKLNPEKRSSDNTLTFFRERNGWCPYSERVWLALEAKELSYDTFLIDNMGARPTWFGGTTPQVQWHDGTVQSESMDIVERLDEKYPGEFSLYPDKSEVDRLVAAFKSTFPRNTRPSSRSAFFFSYSGQPLFKSEFCETLDKTNKLLQKFSGPFFFGGQFTAADCAWAPFLERYAAQLPVLHPGLDPRDRSRWPYIAEWFDAMEGTDVPFYSSRVQGDQSSWRKVLKQAGFGNDGMTPCTVSEKEFLELEKVFSRHTADRLVFSLYAKGKPHVAGSAQEEAAARIVRNSAALVSDMQQCAHKPLGAAAGITAMDDGRADAAFRAVATILLSFSFSDNLEEEIAKATDTREVTGRGRRGGEVEGEGKTVAAVTLSDVTAATAYLDERICVPRDMGRLPASYIRALLEKLRSIDIH